MTPARGVRIACRSCGGAYDVRIHVGLCPICRFDAFLELRQRIDPLAHTVRLMNGGARMPGPTNGRTGMPERPDAGIRHATGREEEE